MDLFKTESNHFKTFKWHVHDKDQEDKLINVFRTEDEADQFIENDGTVPDDDFTRPGIFKLLGL